MFTRWIYSTFFRGFFREEIDKVVDSYEKLIEEYFKILNKQSGLVRKDRNEVVLRVHDLIKRGHIKAL